MISQKTMDALKNIGLNLYERKIYVALLAKSVGTAGELAELASVPRSRSYDVLETLSEKGFALMQHSKPIKYVAIDPTVAIEKTRNILKNSFSKDIMRVKQFSGSNALKELEKLYENGVLIVEPATFSGSFKGKYSINLQVNNMIKNTRKIKKQEFPVLIERDKSGFYIASVPTIKSCRTQAKTLPELYKRLDEAIMLCLEVQEKDGIP
ncbi:MAG: helix-turn-helix domain-containing protein, partial [archaeon]|nr:helix-turn-helix domain-containing protein [archaeon]